VPDWSAHGTGDEMVAAMDKNKTGLARIIYRSIDRAWPRLISCLAFGSLKLRRSEPARAGAGFEQFQRAGEVSAVTPAIDGARVRTYSCGQ